MSAGYCYRDDHFDMGTVRVFAEIFNVYSGGVESYAAREVGIGGCETWEEFFCARDDWRRRGSAGKEERGCAWTYGRLWEPDEELRVARPGRVGGDCV